MSLPLLRISDLRRWVEDRTGDAVSERTLRRDFAALEAVRGIRVEYDPGEGGWMLVGDPGDKLSDLRLTEADVIPLLVARDALEVVSGKPLEQRLRRIIDGICLDIGLVLRRSNDTFSLEDGIKFKAMGAAEAPSPHFDTVVKAVLGRETVSILYRSRDRSKAPQKRLLHPHLLHCYRDQWRLVAWEPAKERMGTYLLSGVQEADLLGTTFERQRGFTASHYFDGAFGVFTGKEDHAVEIHFSAEGAERVRGRLWHKTQEMIDRDDGGLIFKARMNSLVEITSWILGFGPEAWAVQPPELVTRVRTALEKSLARYGGGGPPQMSRTGESQGAN